AQSTKKSLLPPRDGSIASQAMLGGLARCAGCGHTLKITGNTRKKTGQRYPIYYCIGQYASGPCPARATETAANLDQYVEQQVLAAIADDGGPIARAVQASEHLDEATRTVTEAEHELDLYINNPKLLTLLGEQRFLEGAETRQQALDEARTRLAEARSESGFAEELAEAGLLDAWPELAVSEKRRLMHGLLEQVVVRRAEGRGRDREPISERTEITLHGGIPLA
ncbi:MAG TPA: zinc ribbon domain-containing protein, partial [Fimbriimonadaceae bacterium]|nr:zinc ribbon domain-containing protein [Fimbriimonadaceae bacterium]